MRKERTHRDVEHKRCPQTSLISHFKNSEVGIADSDPRYLLSNEVGFHGRAKDLCETTEKPVC